MNKSPAFQFYPDDFMGGKPGMMNPEQTHVYVWLLCLDWNQNGFFFDEKSLARWCRVTPGIFRRTWKVVQENFSSKEGRWFNERLWKERLKQAEWREKSAKGGRSKKQPPFNHPSDLVETKDEPNGNIPLPSPLPTPVTTTTKAKASSSPKAPKSRTAKADSKYPHFPPSVCDAGFEHWIETHGSVEYSTYRKALGPRFRGGESDPTADQLISAQTAHGEAVAEMTTKDAGFETIHKFAGRLTEWMRLGAMPWTDEWGVFTERGRVLGTKALRVQRIA